MSAHASPVIDIHNHISPVELIDEIQAGRFDGFTLERRSSGLELFVGGRRATSMEPARWDLDVRLRDMDRMGVTVQALSPVPLLLGYELPTEQGVRLCRLINDGLARSAAAHPDRFVALAAVPLQEVDEAVRELRRAIGELGMRGVEIGANIDGADPSDERFLPFWATVAELETFVFVHPTWVNLEAGPRMANYHLFNVLGHPMDTSLAVANLIFGGYFERWPGLKCCFCHAGGFAPYQIGRLDHAYKVRPEANRAIPQPPSVYLKWLHFDTIAHNVESLRLVVTQVGPAQVLLGSDYPADMSDPDPVNTVTSLDLEPADRDRILGGNAAALLGIA